MRLGTQEFGTWRKKLRFFSQTIENVNQFKGEGQHSSLLIWFGFIQQWIWNSEKCRAVCSHTCAVGGFELLQTLLNVSLLLWFCRFESVYSSLSSAPASSPTALTCSQQLWFPNTKEWKEHWVHNLFILDTSQWRRQWIKCSSFFLRSSGDCPQYWTKGSIDSDMFISTGVLVFLQGFVVRVVVGRSPSNLYPFMDVDFCSLNLCFISCSSTKGSGNVPGLVFGPQQWLCMLFYFHYHDWAWPGCKPYWQEDADREDLHPSRIRKGLFPQSVTSFHC